MLFIKQLIQSIKDKKSVVCMGLDPRINQEGTIPNYLVEEFLEPNDIILEFNKALIEECHELIPVIKPQIAFYEKYDSLQALKDTIKFAHKHDLMVILDSKRNDIGSTSEAYADSTFQVYGADACTLNAYFGFDGIKPYIERYSEKGMFVLVKTSNPSSSDFQNLFSAKLDDVHPSNIEIDKQAVKLERNYVFMARLVHSWGKNIAQYHEFNNLGVVIGATFPDELKYLRSIVPSSFILIPGYGAQGGSVSDIKYGFQNNGLGGIVNSSRGITYAYRNKKQYSPEEFCKAAKDEIRDMNLSINKAIGLT